MATNEGVTTYDLTASLNDDGTPIGQTVQNVTNINAVNTLTGTPGTDGTDATINVGTTTTLSAGSSATVSNSGSENMAILNFGIPKGADGAAGATGAPGPNQVTSTTSTNLTGIIKGNGTTISTATSGTDYQAPISLTTTGTSGASTLVGNTLNIPQYTGGSGDMVLAGVQTVTGAKTFNVGKLLDKGEIVFDVKAYGATGNGTTDDTAAIQSAIDACHTTAGGGTVWFPAGTYKISTNPLKFYSGATPTIVAYSNIKLSGAGSSGTTGAIINQTTTGVDVIKAINDGANGAQSVGCTIENICVQFTGTATNSGNGVYLSQQSSGGPAYYQWKITNVRANNFQGSGKAGFNFESIIISTVEACHAFSCATGYFFNGAVGGEYGSVSTSVTIVSCYANSPTVTGYRIINGTYISLQSCACDIGVNATSGYSVEGCNSIGFYSCGVELDGTHTLTNGFFIGADASSTGSLGIGLYDCYVFQSKSTFEIYITGTSKGVTMFGYQSNSSVSGSTALKMDANTSAMESMGNLDAGVAVVRTLNASAIDIILGDSDDYGLVQIPTLSVGGGTTLTTTNSTGTGNLVKATSPTLVTPALGTPSAVVLTHGTGLVASTGTTATGTPSSTTYLRGDNTWSTPAAGFTNPMTSVGDIIQGTTAGAAARLAAVATGNALISGGVTTANSWGKIGLTTHVTGTLPVANGGTGSATQNFVDLTTAQTVSGVKTFSAPPHLPASTTTVPALTLTSGAVLTTPLASTIEYDGAFLNVVDSSAARHQLITNNNTQTLFAKTLSSAVVSTQMDFSTANIVTDATTGTKIGTAATQKLGFYGVTPVVKPVNIAAASATVASVQTTVNAVLTLLQSLGLMT